MIDLEIRNLIFAFFSIMISRQALQRYCRFYIWW